MTINYSADLSGIQAILKGISSYADSCAEIELLKKNYPQLLLEGSQYINIIGLFYGLSYARSQYPDCKVEYCKNGSESSADIEVSDNGQSIYIQVKTASAYSLSRRTTPNDFQQATSKIYLITLSKKLLPEGFWIIDCKSHAESDSLLEGVIIPGGSHESTQGIINWGENKVKELLSCI